jgi:hypothetical protein
MVLNVKIFQFLLTFLGSFIGQLIVRITSLDGSFDKWWLLLPPLSVPPLSLIPAFLIYNNKVEKGYAGLPYDLYMLIPAVSSVVLGLVIEKKFNQTGPKGILLKYLVNFLSIGLALYLRDVDKCLLNTNIPTTSIKSIPKSSAVKSVGNLSKEKYIDEDFIQLHKFVEQFNINDKKPSSVSYSKILTHSAIISGILPFLPYIIIKIPYLNEMITTVGQISPYLSMLSDIIIRLLCIMIIYIFINMYNGRNKDKSCSDKYKNNSVITVIFISMMINLLISNKADLIPYNMSELNPQTE